MADLGSTKVFGDLTVTGDIRIGGVSVTDAINAGSANTVASITGMGSVMTAAAVISIGTEGTEGTRGAVHISGNTAITSLGTGTTGMVRTVIFDSALTLTHNPSKIIFPNAGTITTAPGDIFVFLCEDGTNGIWRCISTFPSRIW